MFVDALQDGNLLFVVLNDATGRLVIRVVQTTRPVGSHTPYTAKESAVLPYTFTEDAVRKALPSVTYAQCRQAVGMQVEHEQALSVP